MSREDRIKRIAAAANVTVEQARCVIDVWDHWREGMDDKEQEEVSEGMNKLFRIFDKIKAGTGLPLDTVMRSIAGYEGLDIKQQREVMEMAEAYCAHVLS